MQSRISNHINRNVLNINQCSADYYVSDDDSEIEIVDVNSPRTEQSVSDQHESALNEAWHFINQARQIYNHTEDKQRKTNIPRQHHKNENVNETNNYFTKYESKTVNESYCNLRQKITQERNIFYATINDYLDDLESSSEDEIPSKMKQNYFDNVTTKHNIVNVYENPIYIDDRPILIYSYKNKNFTPEANQELINSSNKDSPISSASSMSVENFDEEITSERNIYKVSNYYNSVVIPRLTLEYTLPTVTEVLEPRQSPKVTEISNEEDVFLQRKTINSWVTIDEESIRSGADNTIGTSVESFLDECSKRSAKLINEEHKNTILVHHTNESINTTVTNDTVKNSDGTKSLNEFETHKTPRSHSRATITLNNNSKNQSNTENKDIDNVAVINDSTAFSGDETFESHVKYFTPSPKHFLSERSSIPTLYLSSSTAIEKANHSWFARLLRCVFCCKVTQ